MVRHYRFNAEQARAQPYTNDPGAISRAYLATTLWYLGLPEQALAMSEQALANARAIAHPHSLATVLAMTARFHTLRRDLERTLAVASETIAVSKEYGFPLWRVQGGLLVSWVQAERGQDPAVEHMQVAIAAYRANGVAVSLPYYAALHAEQLAKRGRLAEARDILSQALEETARTGAFADEPEIRRILGAVLRLEEVA